MPDLQPCIMNDHIIEKKPLLEIACFNEESAILAERGGADRIELCRDYRLGGLSPDDAILEHLKSKLSIPIFVMIRPHPNGFCYTSFEFESMKATMQSLKARGADGFVFGILNESEPGECDPSHGWIDVSRNKQLVQLADGLPCTFHRAFDLIPESEWNFALSDIMDCGFTSILTSGGPSGTQATDCVHKLAILVDWNNKQIARAGKILKKKVPEIIVGGGVRATNIAQLRRITAASVFHSAALRVSSETVCTSEVSSMKEQLHRSLACT